jgi:hypothetical protein
MMANAYMDFTRACICYDLGDFEKSWEYIQKKYHIIFSSVPGDNMKSMAVKQYEVFLKFWKDADPDLPELIDAQKRLNQLRPH